MNLDPAALLSTDIPRRSLDGSAMRPSVAGPDGSGTSSLLMAGLSGTYGTGKRGDARLIDRMSWFLLCGMATHIWPVAVGL